MLDDDPTGSQTVHDVSIVTVPDADTYAAALADPGSTCFILTNSRSLPEAAAVEANSSAGRALFELGRRLDALRSTWSAAATPPCAVTSPRRFGALDTVRAEVAGRGFDGVLFVPAYLEAGRVTAGDVHWARVGGTFVPVGETEFARDATFGYACLGPAPASSSRRGGGRIARATTSTSLSLTDIRRGGPGQVADILRRVTGGRFVVVNATDYADLEVVVLGLLEAQAAGRAFLYRSGPSFVRALAGLEPKPPLTPADIWPWGRPAGHGLVVVGSHVGLTSRQVEVALARGRLAARGTRRDVARRRGDAAPPTSPPRQLGSGPRLPTLTCCSTPRGRWFAGRTPRPASSIARAVSAAVSDVVRGVLPARPAWFVAKGGITAHDVAVRGLGLRRATVAGQLFAGAGVGVPSGRGRAGGGRSALRRLRRQRR